VRGDGFDVAGATEKERIKSADKVNSSAVALGLVKSTDIFIAKNKKERSVRKLLSFEKVKSNFPFLLKTKAKSDTFKSERTSSSSIIQKIKVATFQVRNLFQFKYILTHFEEKIK
jgi:hypothetical protein